MIYLIPSVEFPLYILKNHFAGDDQLNSKEDVTPSHLKDSHQRYITFFGVYMIVDSTPIFSSSVPKYIITRDSQSLGSI